MKIENSNVVMESNLEVQEEHTSTILKQDIKYDFLAQVKANTQKAHEATQSLLHTDFRSTKISSQKVIYSYAHQMSSQDQIKKQTIEGIIDIFFTQNSTTFNYPQEINDEKSLENRAITIKTKEEYYKKQTIDFYTYLEINTPDKNYTMELDISFTKELYEAHSMELKFGNQNLQDPLVINYGENTNPFDNISKLKFEFDLNNDGENELIPLLKQGAGFLAYDENNNNKIDNGSELFGPQTNNGFKELSEFDKDNNNWIDENDSIFDKLKIWQIDETGENSLVSLLELNVGAIYLGEVQSGFTYQNKIDTIDALQRSNGIYVKNDGTGVQLINSIDIAQEKQV